MAKRKSGDEERKPKVGIALLVLRGEEVLVGKRRAGTGPGTWSVPGGLIDFGESFEECAARELREETGLTLSESRFITAASDVMPQYDDHSVTIWMFAARWSGEVHNASPEEHSTWEWRAWSDLPRPLYPSLQNFVSAGWTPELARRRSGAAATG